MYKTQAEVLKAACFRNRVNTIIHTLYQSKFFTFWVPTSHSLETDVNLAIRPKTIISNILVSIPVTHKNKLHVNCFCPFSSSHSEHSNTQLWYIGFYLRKSDSSMEVIFKSVQFFFTSSFAKFHVHTFGWTECFKQVHRHYLMLDSNQILLNFSLQFSFPILIFVTIYSWALVKKLGPARKRILRIFGRNTFVSANGPCVYLFRTDRYEGDIISSVCKIIWILEELLYFWSTF
jgi:hypothetical protein